MKKLAAMLIVSASLLWGCTDADRARLQSYGKVGEIVCYSGGVVIYAGKSTGKIQANKEHTGFEFEDETTHKSTRINGDCVVMN